MAGTVQDITELRRAEQALIDSEARLSAVMSIAPSAVITLDRNGAITMFNKGAENTFGYQAEEIIGRPLALLIPERFRSIHADHEAEFLASDVQNRKMSERAEIYGRRKDGSEFPAEASISKIQLADELLVTVILQDITHRRQRDDALRQAQKMEAVGQLTGGVAHDFNNLLQVILSNAELLSPTSDRDIARRNLILRAAERGSNLTESLLAFSRKQSLEPQAVDLLELIDSVSEMIRSSVGETVSIKTTTDPQLWTVMADPGQIEIALLNLAVNARDAMPTGGNLKIDCRNIRLDNATIMGSRSPVTGEFVILTVEDDGVGMNANVLEHAIEPFFTTKEVGSGSGLGLSMVYGFARQSGGYVEISSEPDHGTSVTLYLPRSREAVTVIDADLDHEPAQGSGERVLVIEDEKNVRRAAAQMLEELGYRVDATKDISAARLAMEEGEKFDLILTDVILPGGVSGPEFAREVLAANENIRFVLMSGYAGDTFNVDDLINAGGIMLKKPFRKIQLAEAVNEALKRQREVTVAES
jgi:PAS domain S-box-containing protein